MRKLLILGLLWPLSACAPDIYDKFDGTPEQFAVDQGGCQMFALGMPQQQAPYIAPSYTANTNYSGTYGYGTVNGVSTTTVQPDNTGQAMANLGAAIGNAVQQRNAMRACMAAHGYTIRQH